MKKLLAITSLFIAVTLNAQDIDTLFMSKLMDHEWTKDFSAQTQFKFIKFEDGSFLGI